MATIERKPLPPPNSRAVTISEADRAEMVGHANEVIDYYLNGPGAYWDAGPRKPLVSGDERGDSTVMDLKRFKDGVIASRQFAEDPNSIIDSIIGLIDRATEQVEQTARNEGKDDISRRPPEINDPIDDPRVISPRFLNNGALPIGLKAQPLVPTPQAVESYGTSSRNPIRVLSRRIANQPPVAFVRSAVEEPSYERMATGFDDDQSVRGLSSRAMPRSASLGGNVYPTAISNRVMGSSQPDRPPSPHSAETPRGLAGRIAALAGNNSANPYPRGLPPYGTEIENDGPQQPWLFRALTGRL